MRAVVLCGGSSGSGRHLREVDGERILDRTVRMAAQYAAEVIIVRPEGDTRYEVGGAVVEDERLDHPLPSVRHMFWPSRHLWASSGRTVLLLGDVWFSEDGMRTIMQNRSIIATFGRMDASELTGCPYGEIWAFAFDSTEHDRIDLAIVRIAKPRAMYGGGTITGWEVLKALGASPWIEIDDFTEDFDSPEDFRKWKESRDAHNNGDISST